MYLHMSNFVYVEVRISLMYACLQEVHVTCTNTLSESQIVSRWSLLLDLYLCSECSYIVVWNCKSVPALCNWFCSTAVDNIRTSFRICEFNSIVHNSPLVSALIHAVVRGVVTNSSDNLQCNIRQVLITMFFLGGSGTQ